MEGQSKRIQDILSIYLKKANSFEEKEAKVVFITGIFNYLSTRGVKPYLMTPEFANFRGTLLKKIHEFKHDAYLRKHGHHRLIALLDELFTYLVQDDSIPSRRSERQKSVAVKRFNARFQECSSPDCMAAKLNALNAPSVPKSVSISPRRSARLMVK